MKKEKREENEKLTKEQQEEIEQDKREFLNCIENTYMSVEQAINLIMYKKPEKYTKKDIAGWLREEMKTKQLSAQVLVKIKGYFEEIKRRNTRSRNNTEGR